MPPPTRLTRRSAGGRTNFALLRQEDQIQYAQLLRSLKTGWTQELSKEFLEWFVMVGKEYTGDVNFNNAIQIIRADAISQIPAAFRPALQGLIDAPLTFTLTREEINVKSVRAKPLEPGYGYIRIRNFQERTGEDLAKALKDMYKQGDLKGLVLDLRDMWPDSIKAVGAMNDSTVIRILERIEMFLYRKAARIVTVTDAFKYTLTARELKLA